LYIGDVVCDNIAQFETELYHIVSSYKVKDLVFSEQQKKYIFNEL